jgi:hypothetical protein
VPDPAKPTVTVSAEAKDFAKQLVLYADAITAFAVVQLLGFIYLLAHGDCFTVNVLYNIYFPTILSFVVNGLYLLLVWRCHRGETSIFGSSRDTAIADLIDRTWKVRYAIIIAAGLSTLFLLWLVAYGMSIHTFSVDCKVK